MVGGGKQQRSLMSEVESEKSRTWIWRDDKVNRQNFFSFVPGAEQVLFVLKVLNPHIPF